MPSKEEGKKLELPEGLDEGAKKRMSNLVQFSGKKKTKSKDLTLSVKAEDIETVKAELIEDGVEIPVLSSNAKHTVPIVIKAVLSKDELKVYINEVAEWFESHPDWTLKEDREDIYGIAMEKVIQYRLMLQKKKHPRSDITKQYHDSAYRVQAFRQNLAARRADRVGGKVRVENQTNIAILASELTMDKLKELGLQTNTYENEEEELFPQIEE